MLRRKLGEQKGKRLHFPVHVQDEAPAEVSGGEELAGEIEIDGRIVAGDGLVPDPLEEIIVFAGRRDGGAEEDRFLPEVVFVDDGRVEG